MSVRVALADDQALVRAGLVESSRQMRHRRKKRRQLHRDGNAHRVLDGRHDIDQALFHVSSAFVRVRGHVVEVQFEPIGTGVLDQSCVGEPPGHRRAIQ